MDKKTRTQKDYVMSAGKRKEAVARVRIYTPTTGKMTIFGKEFKKGDIVVNGKPIQDYFAFKAYAPRYNKVLRAVKAGEEFVISAKVVGGGISGQLDAVVHGIARALDQKDSEKYHATLRSIGALTRDSRIRERRKVGTGGKARRQKQSPKR